ncbi:collectin-12-like [Aplochiton taeniatus]
MTWFESLAYCRANHTDLVSVHTERIQHWVSRRAQQASSLHVWIGLRYTCALDYWFWVSGNSTCYQNWAPDNGGGWEECGRTGAVQRGGEHQWFSKNQEERFNFICSNSTGRF